MHATDPGHVGLKLITKQLLSCKRVFTRSTTFTEMVRRPILGPADQPVLDKIVFELTLASLQKISPLHIVLVVPVILTYVHQSLSKFGLGSTTP